MTKVMTGSLPPLHKVLDALLCCLRFGGFGFSASNVRQSLGSRGAGGGCLGVGGWIFHGSVHLHVW